MSFEPHYVNTYILYGCALILIYQVFDYTIKKVMYTGKYITSGILHMLNN
jgi:hypothetical protein